MQNTRCTDFTISNIYFLTHFMEQFPSTETNPSYPRNSLLFIEPECSSVNSHVPTTWPIRSQSDPVHVSGSHILKIDLNIILPFTAVFPFGLIPPGFPTRTMYAPPLSPITAPFRSHLILLDLINRIIFCKEFKSLSSTLYSFINSPVSSSLLGQYSPQHPILQPLSLRSSLNMSDQVTYPYNKQNYTSVYLNFE